MPKTALILFAHGARDPDWASPLHRVKGAINAQVPGMRVELAFLELMQPKLQECAASLSSDGFERIVILPMFIAQGGHIKKDTPLILDELRQTYPTVTFELAGPVGEAENIIQAIAAHALLVAGEGQA
jgi:sirohydrochlorin cobaltochelatase